MCLQRFYIAEIPKFTDSLFKSVEWSIMSKVADTSSIVRMVTLPPLIDLSMSFVIRKRTFGAILFLYAE